MDFDEKKFSAVVVTDSAFAGAYQYRCLIVYAVMKEYCFGEQL